MKRPYGIALIGYFYIFGAIIILLTLGVNQEVRMNIRFGLPYIPEVIVKISIAIFTVVMAYGYLKLKRWGYWVMVIYSILFLAISLYQTAVYHSQPFIGNAVFSSIVLIYTYANRHCFKPQQQL